MFVLATCKKYQDALRSEFGERVRRNPQYSLRAFARDLNLSPSMLCDVLAEKHHLSRDRAFKVAQGLRLSAPETELFCDLVDAKHARCINKKKEAEKRLNIRWKRAEFVHIEENRFKMMAEWYHLAIFELLEFKDFRADPKWISKVLGIPVPTVNEALERLEFLGIIERRGGTLKSKSGFVETSSGAPSTAVRQYHDGILDKAKQAIFFQDMEERELSALTIAMSAKDVPKAKEMIRNFRREFAKQLSNSSDKDALYMFSMQLFRLDQKETL